MSRYVFKMPDLGEGTVEAEVVAWHVKVGETVQEDQIMAEVMTEKAAVEVPSPVTGRIVSLNGAAGRHGRASAPNSSCSRRTLRTTRSRPAAARGRDAARRRSDARGAPASAPRAARAAGRLPRRRRVARPRRGGTVA